MISCVFTCLAASFTLFQITSCKKVLAQLPNNCPTPTYPVAGLWTGTYLTDQVSHQQLFTSFAFYPDGTLILKSKSASQDQDYIYETGTWTLTGNTLTFTATTLAYSSVVNQKGQFTFSNTGVMTGGTWQDVTSDNGLYYTGTYPTMQRIN